MSSTHTGHTAGTSSTARLQPSASSATIQELRDQITSNARMLFSDIFKRYLGNAVRREDVFDIVVIRKPSSQGILAVLVYGKLDSRKTAMQGDEKRSYFDAMESLLLATANKLGQKTKTARDGSKSSFWEH